jgi:cytoskeletal protein RodZ
MNCAVDCDREVISMWPLGVIAGVIAAGAVARLLVGRDKVAPMERRNRALALLRDLAEQPRTIPDLVPPPEARTDHVRILEEAPAVGRNPRRASSQRPAARRARAARGAKPRSSASTAAKERTTIEIRSSLARVPGVVVGAAEPETGAQMAVPSSASHASSRSSSRAVAVALAAAFVLAVIGVVAAVGLSGHGTARATASKPHQDRAAKPRSVASTPTTSAPSTTAPARVAPVAPVVARSTNGATVSVHSPFRLSLRASGTCWVEITDATGHTLFTATLHSGQQQQIPGAGPIVVRIGYTPAMTISVDGIDLDLSGLGQTTNLSFQSV